MSGLLSVKVVNLDASVPLRPVAALGAVLYISSCSVLLLLVRFPLRFYFGKQT